MSLLLVVFLVAAILAAAFAVFRFEFPPSPTRDTFPNTNADERCAAVFARLAQARADMEARGVLSLTGERHRPAWPRVTSDGPQPQR